MLADWKSAQCENKEPSLQSTSQIAKGTRIRTLLRNLQFDENHWRSRKPEWWKWWDYRLGPNLPHNARESHPVSNLHSDLSFHSWFINGYNYLQNHSGKGFFQRFCKALAKGSLAVCIFFHLRKCAQDLRCILFSWELLKMMYSQSVRTFRMEHKNCRTRAPIWVYTEFKSKWWSFINKTKSLENWLPFSILISIYI